jgi:hypothetical protein
MADFSIAMAVMPGRAATVASNPKTLLSEISLTVVARCVIKEAGFIGSVSS